MAHAANRSDGEHNDILNHIGRIVHALAPCGAFAWACNECDICKLPRLIVVISITSDTTTQYDIACACTVAAPAWTELGTPALGRQVVDSVIGNAPVLVTGRNLLVGPDVNHFPPPPLDDE